MYFIAQRICEKPFAFAWGWVRLLYMRYIYRAYKQSKVCEGLYFVRLTGVGVGVLNVINTFFY